MTVTTRPTWRACRETPSYRRLLIDRGLAAVASRLRGLVLDLGGRRHRQRGTFRRAEGPDTRWVVINLDRAAGADCVADVHHVPVGTSVADWVVCTEVLEHVARPETVVQEMLRVLKPSGAVIVTVPFLHPVHADPGDFQRWVPDGLRTLFHQFEGVTISPMGHTAGTLASLIEQGTRHWRSRGWPSRVAGRVVFEGCRLAQWTELGRQGDGAGAPAMTTGYFVIAEKGRVSRA